MIEIEFNEDTLVSTIQGVQRLGDLMQRETKPALWAIKWRSRELHAGISFHASHKAAREMAQIQHDCEPVGPARLINVSQKIIDCVEANGFCWTSLENFDDAETFEGEIWHKNH